VAAGRDDGRSARLAEQVKLLVKTEQRLTQAQREVERQLARVHALNGFALVAPHGGSPEAIAGQAIGLLWSLFGARAALVVLPRPHAPLPAVSLRAGDQPLTAVSVEDAGRAWATRPWPARPEVISARRPPEGLAAVLDALAPPDTWEARAAFRCRVFLPLGAGAPGEGGGPGALVCRCASAGRAQDVARPGDVPFLGLVAAHTTGALALAARRAAVGQLAAEVAHEIANPLAALKANLEWIFREGPAAGAEDRTEATEESLSALARIGESAARLRRLAAEAVEAVETADTAEGERDPDDAAR